MKKFLQKPFRWAAIYSVIISLSVTFILLDTFVIPRAGTAVITAVSQVTSASADNISQDSTEDTKQTGPEITATSYKDENIQIKIDTVRKYDTDFYVADIQVTSVTYLKTAFAKNIYGRNINETTSAMAEEHNAIFAINGDYYGFRDYGFVLRNGVLYRSATADNKALVFDNLGNLSVIDQTQKVARTLSDGNMWQVLSFGPALIDNGEIIVTKNSEVEQSMKSNPRTAIGQVSALHYIVIVSDGRTNKSAGLSLLELADEFFDRGCTVAYNLDGGGSATMWFNGKVINIPTDGKYFGERSVSDIVYIGSE
jgi:exopolysaccharide biosynthesis protein